MGSHRSRKVLFFSQKETDANNPDSIRVCGRFASQRVVMFPFNPDYYHIFYEYSFLTSREHLHEF